MLRRAALALLILAASLRCHDNGLDEFDGKIAQPAYTISISELVQESALLSEPPLDEGYIRELVEEPNMMQRLTTVAQQAVISEYEMGGEVCMNMGGLDLIVIKNSFIDYWIDPDEATTLAIPQMRRHIQEDYIDGNSSPYKLDPFWKIRIDEVLDLIECAELMEYENNLLMEPSDDYSFLRLAVNAYNEMLKDRYGKSETGVCGRRQADFHTHNNATDFSATDLSLTVGYNQPELLISVSKSCPVDFAVYYAEKGKSFLVGRYLLYGSFALNHY